MQRNHHENERKALCIFGGGGESEMRGHETMVRKDLTNQKTEQEFEEKKRVHLEKVG